MNPTAAIPAGRPQRRRRRGPALRLLAALGALAAFAGCAGIDPQVYAREQPALDLRQWFDGRIVGHGMVLDRSGEVQRRFVVEIQATWTGSGAEAVGTLDESFVWSDGERQRRVWTLRPAADGGWQGSADDVVGSARGVVAGNALNWRYTLRVQTRGGSTWKLDFDDWMFLIDERVLMNRAQMSFWGLRVGEVLIAFNREAR